VELVQTCSLAERAQSVGRKAEAYWAWKHPPYWTHLQKIYVRIRTKLGEKKQGRKFPLDIGSHRHEPWPITQFNFLNFLLKYFVFEWELSPRTKFSLFFTVLNLSWSRSSTMDLSRHAYDYLPKTEIIIIHGHGILLERLHWK